ncbi:unnamed protein product [Caenorhabditis nigoni]
MEEENPSPPPTGSESSQPSSPLRADFDTKIHLTYSTDDDKIEEEILFGHRTVLSTFSPILRQLIDDATSSSSPTSSSSTSSESSSDECFTSIKLDLSLFPNALCAFKVILDAMYSGDIKMAGIVQPNEILAICQFCQISFLDQKIISLASTAPPMTLASALQCSNPFLQYTSTPPNYLSTMLNLWTNPFFGALFGSQGLAFSPPSESRTQSEGSSPRGNSSSTPPTTDLEKIVPNDDKEGWCRNKKYIEKVDGGFMCTVCRKIYGRYNSVSYHVTIYHRNPPIKCEENGCNFSTREARYIHFHKYYRHHIPLPENIDLGSRKCPFCRHVSKSPAMLEKHIARHETEGPAGSPIGALKRAQSKKKIIPTSSDVIAPSTTSTSSSIFGPSAANSNIPIQCSLCTFSTNSTDLLFIHLAMQHTQELAQCSGLLTDSSSEASTSSSSDGEPMITDIDLDIKPLIDQSLMLHLNATPLSN